MSLTVNKQIHKNGKAFITDDYATLLKIVRVQKTDDIVNDYRYFAPFRGNEYKQDDITPRVKIAPDENGLIHEGYHAYYKLTDLLGEYGEDDEYIPTVCMIPPKTRYYLGVHGDIVAERMTVSSHYGIRSELSYTYRDGANGKNVRRLRASIVYRGNPEAMFHFESNYITDKHFKGEE